MSISKLSFGRFVVAVGGEGKCVTVFVLANIRAGNEGPKFREEYQFFRNEYVYTFIYLFFIFSLTLGRHYDDPTTLTGRTDRVMESDKNKSFKVILNRSEKLRSAFELQRDRGTNDLFRMLLIINRVWDI